MITEMAMMNAPKDDDKENRFRILMINSLLREFYDNVEITSIKGVDREKPNQSTFNLEEEDRSKLFAIINYSCSVAVYP